MVSQEHLDELLNVHLEFNKMAVQLRDCVERVLIEDKDDLSSRMKMDLERVLQDLQDVVEDSLYISGSITDLGSDLEEFVIKSRERMGKNYA